MGNSHFDSTPEQRWAEQQRAADALDPWRDHSKTLTRDAAGNLVQVARVPDTEQRLDDAAYARLTWPEKVAYAARFSQQR
jgi:hypothetical protein